MSTAPSPLIVRGLQLRDRSEPWTKEKWRTYVETARQAPPAMPADYAVYERLRQQQREALDALRLRYHNGLPMIRTPQVEGVWGSMDQVMYRNLDPQNGSHPGLVVDGPAYAGKSTAVKMYARELERSLRTERPELFLDTGQGNDETIPIVYITLTAGTTPKMLSHSLANFFGLPQSRRRSLNTADITDAVLIAIERCRTVMIIVDEIHFLDCSQKEGRLANDHLKHLMNSTGATFIYVGVDVESKGLFSEGGAPGRMTQTAARFLRHDMPYFPHKTAADKKAWARTIRSFESTFALYRHEDRSLAAHAEYLHERTQGRMGSLSELLRTASQLAIQTGQERVDLALLANTATDRASQLAFQTSQRTRRRASTKKGLGG